MTEKSTYSFCPVSALFPEASDTTEIPDGECPSVRPTEGKLGEKQSPYGSRFKAKKYTEIKQKLLKFYQSTFVVLVHKWTDFCT